MMSIDEASYSRAFDRFVAHMDGLSHGGATEENALREICGMLRVARIEAAVFSSADCSEPSPKRVVYSAEEAGMPPIAFNHTIDEDRTAVYYVYPAKGAEWDDADSARIRTLISLLFVYVSRNRVMATAEHMVYRDRTLDVYSMQYYFKIASELISKGEIGRYCAAYFNIRRLSVINRNYGRDVGTIILGRFISGLKSALTDKEYVCRIGGDNFIVLFYKWRVNDIIEYLSGTAVEMNGSEVIVSARVGLYEIPEDCAESADIMDRTSEALGAARSSSRVSYVFYDEKLRKNIDGAKTIESLFPAAIKNEEFHVFYQPKAHLSSYALTGAEALCRWQHDGETIQPGRFIPVLERNHSICTLDFYMLDHVCRDIRRWLDMGLNVVKISVNLSRVHLGNHELLENIMEIINAHSVPHEYIEIELTETTTDVDFTELKRIVTGLRAQGISTSVDDFGIGYSSLNLIRELPWNVLKIDKSFLPDKRDANAADIEQKKIMLKYVIAMAQSLGLECIVEGVETIEQVDLLKTFNCFRAQGFFFDRPMPHEMFETRLRSFMCG